MRKRNVRSPGKEAADAITELCERLMDFAAQNGSPEAAQLASIAMSDSINSRSAYEASRGLGGGSSIAWSLRREGKQLRERAVQRYWTAIEALTPILRQPPFGSRCLPHLEGDWSCRDAEHVLWAGRFRFTTACRRGLPLPSHPPLA